ncbi:hypothetical protein FCULG_00012611 [Fusarium culmorum]|uniref:Uncharacterized protein n=1 Tax=Fusarium culmorum TaxID=5516 RepID=A0A2T4GG73_FUSCU|nr:hypothetical protein FCULG_00012611 [Fusarium culmorum]
MSLSQVLPYTQFLAAFQNARDPQLLHLATTSVAAKPPLLMGPRISLKHDSLVQEVKLKTINGSPTLVSIPIGGYRKIIASPKSVSDKTITTDPASASLPSGIEQGAYIILATISKNNGDKGNEVRFIIKSDRVFSITIGYDFMYSQAFLVRDLDGSATDSMAAGLKQAYDTMCTAPDPTGGSCFTT